MAACSFANEAKGKVVVTKNTTGGDGTFVFTLRNGITMSATISTTLGIGTATFSLVPAGTYTVSETANPDFVLLTSACVPGTAGAPNSPTVIVGPCSMAACSFANQ